MEVNDFAARRPQSPSSGTITASTLTARFVIRRDATSRSDGRVTDVLTISGGAAPQPAVFLANPTGGRVEPAALAEFCRRAVATAAPIYDDPHDVLLRLDDLVAVHHPGVFMSALFGTVETHDDHVAVCVANRGHVLPIVASAESIYPVGLHGTILGVTGRLARPRIVTRVVLRDGDQIVLVNDRPLDTPIPQPYRTDIVRSRPLGLSDHDLAAHVIDLYDNQSVDVIVISAGSADSDP